MATAFQRSAHRGPETSSLYRGTVSEVTSRGVWVYVSGLGPQPLGPMPSYVDGVLVGDAVVVGALRDSRNDLVVVASSAPARLVIGGVVHGLSMDAEGKVIAVPA